MYCTQALKVRCRMAAAYRSILVPEVDSAKRCLRVLGAASLLSRRYPDADRFGPLGTTNSRSTNISRKPINFSTIRVQKKRVMGAVNIFIANLSINIRRLMHNIDNHPVAKNLGSCNNENVNEIEACLLRNARPDFPGFSRIFTDVGADSIDT